jgi:hypothetical protein
MKSKDLGTVADAARHLAVSESTLKSIMTEKGEMRYGADTLEEVLKKTGYRESND